MKVREDELARSARELTGFSCSFGLFSYATEADTPVPHLPLIRLSYSPLAYRFFTRRVPAIPTMTTTGA